MQLPPPVIVVPGITATYLRDDYPLPPETVWTVLTKRFDRILMHPDNLNFEANQPARVLPGQVYEIAYRELIEELRYNLSPYADMPVPVYAFGYDWRQPLEATDRQLEAFVAEVVERTKLMRHYADAGYEKKPTVNLVGHSMGGLIIAGYMNRMRGKAPVSKVATLATPYQGSFEAVIKTVTGTADLGNGSSASREREAARATPALYHLIPTIKDSINITPDLKDYLDKGGTLSDKHPSLLSRDLLFDPTIWQPSIFQSIGEYIRLYGIRPAQDAAELNAQARELFGSMLGTACQYRERLNMMELEGINFDAKNWLAVVGVDADTRVGMSIRLGEAGKPSFVLDSKDRFNQWSPKAPGQTQNDIRQLTGDGTVPFLGAVPSFLKLEQLVCITPGDYGYWEVKDKVLTKGAGFHGILPNMNMLQRMLVRFFKGEPERHGNTWGWRAPGVAEGAWDPPIEGLLDRTND